MRDSQNRTWMMFVLLLVVSLAAIVIGLRSSHGRPALKAAS